MEQHDVNVSVGLVSATSFRVPSAGVLDTFGSGSLRLPYPAFGARGDVERPSGSSFPVPYADHLTSSVSADQAARAATILFQEDALTSLHRARYAPVQRPVVPAMRPLDEEAIRRQRADLAREGVRWFDVQTRRRALRTATALADHEIGEAAAANEAWVAGEEQRLDAWWDGLCGNDPGVVTEFLQETYRATETPAKPLAVHGGLLDVAVLIPGDHVLPGYSVHLVDGRLSIRRASRARRAQLHRRMVAGLLIAVARQTLAAAPGLTSVRLHALRTAHRGRYDDLSLIAVAELGRQDLAVADLADDAETLLLRYASGLRWVTHSSDGPLTPLVLEDAPALADVLGELCRTSVGVAGTAVSRGVAAPA